jgi:hypothetical protein
MRWGIARGKGTIVGTCDDNTEVRVRWDEDRREGRNVKCGKRGDYWLMTAGGTTHDSHFSLGSYYEHGSYNAPQCPNYAYFRYDVTTCR